MELEEGGVESKITFYFSFLHYRFLIKDSIRRTREKNVTFRDLKRTYAEETKNERKISQQFAIAHKATYYEALKVVDREIGKLSLFEVFGYEPNEASEI